MSYTYSEDSMRKFICSVLISLLCSTVFAQRIAVIDFNAGVGISQAEVDGISAIFNTYFSPQGYTLVERMRVDRVIDEQQFQRGKLTEQQMIRIGQILNISQIVVGDVNIVMNQYNIDVRVLNVQSGTIAAKDGVTWSPGSSYRTMMQQLATRLASQIAIKPNTVVSSSQTNISGQKEVIVLYNYLKVYPKDLGEFDSYPQRVVEQINKNADYGYDTWRLPTKEEMQLIIANKGEIGGLTSTNYMTSNAKNTKGTVRLVTDGAPKSVAYEAYKMCSTIDEYRHFVQRFPSGTYTEMAKVKIKYLEDQLYSINGHRYVDLGLPSGTKWAACNVGANSPIEYGNYYAWGETFTKSSYGYDNSTSYEKNLGEIAGVPDYDPALAAWGSGWRLPTAQELQELVDMCVWRWRSYFTRQGPRYGYEVIGPNGNSIFLPAAGYRYESSLKYGGAAGYYWSSSPSDGRLSFLRYAYCLFFNRSGYELSGYSRVCGRSVRPVTD